MEDTTKLQGMSIADLGTKTMVQVALILLENGTPDQKAQALAVLNGKPVPKPALTVDPTAELIAFRNRVHAVLLEAATHCGHTIDSEEVILYRSEIQPGNALSQLSDRLIKAVEPFLNPPLPEELRRIGHLIRTQDNRGTDQPLYIVQQKKRIYGFGEGYGTGTTWIDKNDGELNDKEQKYHERRWMNNRYVPDDLVRIGYEDIWEFVTSCFTKQGCQDFIDRDGHNLNEPRITETKAEPILEVYADGSYRNAEYRTIRNWLMSLPPPSQLPE